MTAPKSSRDPSQGSPNLGYLEYLQENWTSTEIKSVLHVAKTVVGPSGNSGVAVDIPMGAEINNVHVICTTSSAGGTMTVKTGAISPISITDAITCETNTAITRAGTIDDDYNIVGINGIKVFAGQVTDEGNVYITYKV